MSPDHPAHTDCHDNTAVLPPYTTSFSPPDVSLLYDTTTDLARRVLPQAGMLLYCTMMLLIRLEFIRLTEQAECLMKQPVTALHIFIIHLIVRLVTNTGEFLTALKLHGESELFRLCRTNVEECHRTSENRSAVSVFHDIKLDSLPICLQTFCWIVIFAIA